MPELRLEGGVKTEVPQGKHLHNAACGGGRACLEHTGQQLRRQAGAGRGHPWVSPLFRLFLIWGPHTLPSPTKLQGGWTFALRA